MKGETYMNEIKDLLNEEIRTEVEELGRLNPGTEAYDSCIRCVAQLYDKYIDLERLEIEKEAKAAQRNLDAEVKFYEIDSKSKDERNKNRITATGIVLPLIVASCWCFESLNFEKTGVVGSTVGKNMFNAVTKLKFW